MADSDVKAVKIQRLMEARQLLRDCAHELRMTRERGEQQAKEAGEGEYERRYQFWRGFEVMLIKPVEKAQQEADLEIKYLTDGVL